MEKIKILVLEDDPNILSSNIKILQWEGYEPLGAASIAEAREVVKNNHLDAFVLDVNLPDGSGVDFCRELRQHHHGPVLFLTAMDTKADMLKGFRAGGNDYIEKPFDVDEFLARLEALLELASINATEDETFGMEVDGSIALDTQALRVSVNGEDVGFTPREFALFHYLFENFGRKISPEKIYRDVWKETVITGMSPLYKAISSVNKKLSAAGADMTISNFRGEGYMLER